jgi:uncharacterized membrane protein HdeD (DUF308 family)
MRETLSAVANVVALILCVGFLGAGMVKLVGVQGVPDAFEKWGYPAFTQYLIGIIELGLFILFFLRKTRVLASIIALVLMAGAIYTHVANMESDQLYGPALIIFLSTVLIIVEFLKNKDKLSN